MSSPVNFPASRDFSATTPSAADLISALVLPSIDPLGTAIPPAEYVVAVMQAGLDDTIAALAAIKHLEDSTAACKAALIERLVTLSTLELRALELDTWQDHIASFALRSELACVLHIPEGTAGRLLEHSTALIREHPNTWAALNNGEISWRHAGIVLDEIEILNNTGGMFGEEVAGFETKLLAKAPTTTASGFKNTARRLRERTRPETITTRTRAAYLERSMTLEPRADGMALLTLKLPAPTAQGIWNHCTLLARTQQRSGRQGTATRSDATGGTAIGGEPLGETAESRTLTQLRIDIAANLLLNHRPGTPYPGIEYVNAGNIGGTSRETDQSPTVQRAEVQRTEGQREADFWSGVDLAGENALEDQLQVLDDLDTGRYVTEPPLPRAQILVTVPLLGLLGLTNEPAELEGHGPISNEVARRLLIDATSFLRVLTDPFTGEALATSPETYRVSKKMRLTLQARDKNCQFPGCPRHVFDTDLDHIIAWEQGGTSTEENLENLCRKHHLVKHFKDNKDRHGKYRHSKDRRRAGKKLRGWTPQTTPNGTIAWTSPSGRYYPPPDRETPPPSYPGWLKSLIQTTIV